MKETEDILIVDDNQENLKVLATFLKPRGYKIRIAKNGLQALKSVDLKPPRLILLDIQMPKMGGFETCRRLKKNPETANIPIIFVSALSETLDKVKAFNIGAVDYIEKPFQMEEVLARVNTQLTVRSQKEQLEEALSKVNVAQNKLIQSEKLASLGVLTAGIAHEINNPINFVSAGAAGVELDLKDLFQLIDFYESANIGTCSREIQDKLIELKESIDYDYLRKNLMLTVEDIKMGAERTAEIVKGLKHFSRIDTEEQFEIDLHKELSNNIKIIERLSKKDIVFYLDFDNDTQPIYGYPGQINQLFMNLLMNAEQAIGDQGEIKVLVKSQRKGAKIIIEDNGCGIPREVRNRIFEPFLTTKDVGMGTGLGLSISFGIIENHKGKISYTSEEGVGTRFNIYLPYKTDINEI